MPSLVKNKKAYHDYEVLEKIEAGIDLQGTEVKSCREKNIAMTDGYASIENGEVILHNVHIAPYNKARPEMNHEPTRDRRLLLKKSEIRSLARETLQKGCTLVPLSFYLKRHLVKVELGVCRGRQKGDKREALRRKDDERQMRQLSRNF